MRFPIKVNSTVLSLASILSSTKREKTKKKSELPLIGTKK